ncbi:MAG: radical SAM protein [Nitrospirota bacterium]
MLHYKEIFLGGRCNNNCLYCSTRHKDSAQTDFNSISTVLNQKDGENVVIYGGEPTLRSDFFEIILGAQRNDYQRIKLITNGRILSDIQFLFRIFNAGCYLFEMKLWGSNPDLHDYLTQSPGSFRETIKGLENLQRISSDKFIYIRIPLCKQNYGDIENTVAMALNFGVNRIILALEDYNLAFKLALPHIRNALNISIFNRVWILTEGLPFCVMQGLEQHLSEIYTGWQTIYDRNYRHHKNCRNCVYHEICPGIEIRYLKQFGDRELLPVKSSKYFHDIKALYG